MRRLVIVEMEEIFLGNYMEGGVCGMVYANTEVVGCLSEGNVSGTTENGSLFGRLSNRNNGEFSLKDCYYVRWSRLGMYWFKRSWC